MYRRTPLIWAVAVLALCMVGCSSIKHSQDEEFARKVVEGIFSGSLNSVRDRLAPEMQEPAMTKAIAAIGPVLKERLGQVKELRLKSEGPSQKPEYTDQVWSVTTQNGHFELRLVFDKENKLAGAWPQSATK